MNGAICARGAIDNIIMFGVSTFPLLFGIAIFTRFRRLRRHDLDMHNKYNKATCSWDIMNDVTCARGAISLVPICIVSFGRMPHRAHFRCDLVEISPLWSCHKYSASRMPSYEISSLTRRALNLLAVRMLTCICFSISRMGICTKLGPGPFRCLHVHHRKPFVASCRSVS